MNIKKIVIFGFLFTTPYFSHAENSVNVSTNSSRLEDVYKSEYCKRIISPNKRIVSHGETNTKRVVDEAESNLNTYIATFDNIINESVKNNNISKDELENIDSSLSKTGVVFKFKPPSKIECLDYAYKNNNKLINIFHKHDRMGSISNLYSANLKNQYFAEKYSINNSDQVAIRKLEGKLKEEQFEKCRNDKNLTNECLDLQYLKDFKALFKVKSEIMIMNPVKVFQCDYYDDISNEFNTISRIFWIKNVPDEYNKENLEKISKDHVMLYMGKPVNSCPDSYEEAVSLGMVKD